MYVVLPNRAIDSICKRQRSRVCGKVPSVCVVYDTKNPTKGQWQEL